MQTAGGGRMTADELHAYLNKLHREQPANPSAKSSPTLQNAGRQGTQSTSKQAIASAATHTYDNYRQKWEKFDIDAALRSLDDQNAAQPTNAPKSDAEPAALPEDEWRERGNAHFKSGAFKAAVDCYTSSIECQPTCVGYANRAMAKLKLKDFTGAEKDCTAALEFDSNYVKAWLRRGAARREQGSLEGAIEDFEAALLLEPGNKFAAEDRRACIAQWIDQNGVLPPELVAIPVKLATLSEKTSAGAGQGSTTADADLLTQVSTKRTVNGHNATITTPVLTKAVVEEILEEESEAPPMLPGQIPAAAAAAAAAAAIVALPDKASPQPMEIEEEIQSAEIQSATISTPRKVTQSQPTPPQPPSAPHAVPATSINDAEISPPPIVGASASTVHPLVPSLKAPRTGVDFERAWRGFKGDLSLQAAYLTQISAPQLPVLLKQVLTPGLLVALQVTLLGPVAAQNSNHAAALMGSLHQVPRFSMNLMSLSTAQKKELKAAWDTAVEIYPDVVPLRSKYAV